MDLISQQYLSREGVEGRGFESGRLILDVHNIISHIFVV